MINGTTIGIVVGCVNLFGLFYFGVMRMTRVESRVDILWSFLLRRGVLEAAMKGVLEHNSPLAVPAGMVSKYGPLLKRIDKYYRGHWKKLKDTELAEAIERGYWPQVMEMALAENIYEGACLAVIINYVRPDAHVFAALEPLLGKK